MLLESLARVARVWASPPHQVILRHVHGLLKDLEVCIAQSLPCAPAVLHSTWDLACIFPCCHTLIPQEQEPDADSNGNGNDNGSQEPKDKQEAAE
eukprot:scaffold235741_cov24-Tisochrysis_lutea.AAC.2